MEENECGSASVTDPGPTLHDSTKLCKIQSCKDHGLSVRHRITSLLMSKNICCVSKVDEPREDVDISGASIVSFAIGG